MYFRQDRAVPCSDFQMAAYVMTQMLGLGTGRGLAPSLGCLLGPLGLWGCWKRHSFSTGVGLLSHNEALSLFFPS